jgi:hypothetical protein
MILPERYQALTDARPPTWPPTPTLDSTRAPCPHRGHAIEVTAAAGAPQMRPVPTPRPHLDQAAANRMPDPVGILLLEVGGDTSHKYLWGVATFAWLHSANGGYAARQSLCPRGCTPAVDSANRRKVLCSGRIDLPGRLSGSLPGRFTGGCARLRRHRGGGHE